MSNKIAEIVSEKVIAKLEQGIIPWKKPWSVNDDLPRNVISNKVYRGVNVWLLMFEGYNNPFWLTFKQVTELGGKVKKGAKSTMIIYWNFKVFEDSNSKGELVAKSIPFLKYYNVFNIEQTEGCNFPAHIQEYFDNKNNKIPTEFNPVEKAETIFEGYKTKPNVTNMVIDRAFYSLTKDEIILPPKTSFTTNAHYYGTLFHELGHSTGHPKRLNRKTLIEANTRTKDHMYSKEELVAEMTSSMLLATAGLFSEELENNTVGYVQSWLSALKNDTNLFISACQMAQKATDYILGEVISNEDVSEALLTSLV